MISMTNSRDREHPNLIFNDNTLKFGVFGFDAVNSCAVTMAPKRHILDRDRDLKMV